ncbi:hypothetical protein NP493_15g03057 [Ridgeia piscesae]|uniref:Uncharacterized protein n=1 Tax=Ridgeia piscesae TaxID=27915 RepID=A0AAD9PEL3_RIDPI|nr:hypothetical protein NP493_15g03057 [Ridgeia piscesae]
MQSGNNISNVLDVHDSESNCVMNVDASAITVHLTVNNVLATRLDTGSAMSMIPVDVYQSHSSNCQVQSSNKVLSSFTDNQSDVKTCVGCI